MNSDRTMVGSVIGLVKMFQFNSIVITINIKNYIIIYNNKRRRNTTMMLRPRNYGVLNRSIARSVSYSLRNANRGRSRSKVIHNNTNTEMSTSEAILIAIIALIVYFGLAIAFPTFGIISLIIIFFICMCK